MTPPILATDFPRSPRHCRRPGRHLIDFADSPINAPQRDERRSCALLLAACAILLWRYTRQETLALALATKEGIGIVELTIDDGESGAALLARCEELLASLPKVQSVTPAPSEALPVALALGSIQTAATPHGSDWHFLWADPTRFEQGIVDYDAALFLPASMQRLEGHLDMLLRALLHEPHRAVAELPLLTAKEHEQLTRLEYGGIDTYPAQPLHRHVEAHALRQPEAVAVSFNDLCLTYAELERRANRLAHYLRSEGVAGGMPVAVLLEPGLDLPICVLAIFKAGGAHLPLDPSYPAQRLATILEDTNPRVVLTQSHLLHLLPTPPEPAHILCQDRDQARFDGFSDLPCAADPPADQAAFIVYTSGTTGRPKGVVMSHANLIHYIFSAQHRYGFNRDDVFPAVARFSFSITMFEVLSPLVAGGRLIVLERAQVLDFNHLTKVLQESTVLHASPSLLRKLVAYIQEQDIPPASFASLRHVSSGGDMVPPDLLATLQHRFPHADLFVIYGSSEIGCMGTTYPVPRDGLDANDLRVYVGSPFKNVTVRLYDERGQRVPVGVTGEIHFAGDGLALGYLNHPALTAEKFVQIEGRRFYRTGDMGRLNGDGKIEFLGRNDFQIKLRGIRIELAEIEAVLRTAPGVREGAAALRELTQNEQGLVAYVALTANGELRPIYRHLQEKLPDYMLPSAFVVLDTLPVNHNMKLDRRALPAPTAADFTHLRTFVSPRSALERQLVTLWETILNVRPIGIRDNFFELGGNSLLSVSLLLKIESTFGKTLSLKALLTDPTVEHVASLLCAEPQNAIERKIHGVFLHALNLVRLGIDDDLTQLGASTKGLARAIRALENDLGFRLPSSALNEHRTIRALANQMRQRASRTEPIPLGRNTQGRPLFMVAGVYIYRHLAQRLEDSYNTYGVYSGLELLLFEPNQQSAPSVADLARDYAECILHHQPEGPYRLAGLSFGGILAYEVAQQLSAAGKEVAFLALFDTMLPESGPWMRWIKFGRLLRLPWRDQRQVISHWLTRRLGRGRQMPQAQFARHQKDPALAAMELRREEAYSQAAHRYAMDQVQPYPGAVTLVVANRRLRQTLGRADCGWRPYVKQLTVHTVDADHLDMMEEPNVAVVAAALSADLARCDDAPPKEIEPKDIAPTEQTTGRARGWRSGMARHHWGRTQAP